MGVLGKYISVVGNLLHGNSHSNLNAFKDEKLLFHGTNSYDLRANDWKDDGRYVLDGGDSPIFLFDNRVAALGSAVERISPIVGNAPCSSASLIMLAVNVELVRDRLKEFFRGTSVGVDFLNYGEYLSKSFEFSTLDDVLEFERDKIEKFVFDALLKFDL